MQIILLSLGTNASRASVAGNLAQERLPTTVDLCSVSEEPGSKRRAVRSQDGCDSQMTIKIHIDCSDAYFRGVQLFDDFTRTFELFGDWGMQPPGACLPDRALREAASHPFALSPHRLLLLLR